MKKISQMAIIFMLVMPAFLQVNAIDSVATSTTDDIDPSYVKVNFDIKEVVLYPNSIVLIKKEAIVSSGSKFYTEVEGSAFPGCLRIIEDGATIRDITIKNRYTIYTPTKTNIFDIATLLRDNIGKAVEIITSDGFYLGEVMGVVSEYIFLKNVEFSKIFGNTIEQRNVSFICLKLSDIKNIIMMDEPDLPDIDEPDSAKVDSSPKTRITWEDTGGNSRKVTLIYVISGISWKSEYFLDTYTPFEDQTEDNSRLEHWASITSSLDTDLVDVNVRLVAGDIKLENIGGNYVYDDIYMNNAAQKYLNFYEGKGDAGYEPTVPSSFTMQEFVVYTLPYKITIKKGDTKRIQIQTCDVEIVEEFVYEATHFSPSRNTYSTWKGEESGKVQKILRIKNNGKTWPAGMVSVYEDYMLTGQDGIEWTPKGQEAKVSIGVASDIDVKKKATVKKINPENRYDDDYDYTITIELHSFKDEQVTIKIFDNFVSDALNLKSNPSFEERPGNQMSWEITLNPGESKDVVYTYETRD
jgi:hypothetical protein